MIENVEQLIEQANLIEYEEERVKFLINYFYKTVEYDYAYLLASGYMKGTISALEPRKLRLNPFSVGKITLPINGELKEFDDSYVIERKAAIGESPLFDKIVKLQEDNKGNKESFYIGLQELLEQELSLHINNDDIVKKEVASLIIKVKKIMASGQIKNSNGKDFFISNDISEALSQFIADSQGKRFFPSVIENGLLRRGVCEHYADYLVWILSKAGIEAHRIDGTSELAHAWVAVNIDGVYKSVDLTRAIFIRDGFKGIPREQTADMWLLCNFEDVFAMQSTRTIKGHDLQDNGSGKLVSIPFETIMDGGNFSQEELQNVFNTQKNISQKF